jgi:hypothetical protein
MQRYNPANPFLPANFWGMPPTQYAPVNYGTPLPPSSPVMGDMRLGDWNDRRRTFGNCLRQPMLPYSFYALPNTGMMDVGHHWDRTQVFGNSFQQPFLSDGIPWGQYYVPPAPPAAFPMMATPPTNMAASIQKAM